MGLNLYSKFSLSKVREIFRKYRGELRFTTSNYSTLAATMLSNVIAVKYITPNEFGIINSVLLILPYTAFLHFGVFNALNRNIALFQSQGAMQRVQRYVDASYSVAIYNSITGAIIYIGTIIFFFNNGYSAIYYVSSISLCLSLILGPFATHYEITFRSSQHFKVLGRINDQSSLIYLLVSFLPIYLGYLGRVVANSLRIVTNFYLRLKYHPIKSKYYGNADEISDLIKIGFPLLIGGYVSGLFIASDRSVIAFFLGTEQLGLYSLSVILMSMISVIPTSLNTLLYPKASAAYGRTKSNYGLRKFYFKALLINILAIFPIVIILYIFLEPFVAWFLPQYVAGIPAAKINLLTCLTFIYNGPSVIMAIVRRSLSFTLINILGLSMIWGTAFLIPRAYLNLEFVAGVRFIVALLLSVIVLLYSYYLTTIQEYRE